jgi:hypothetical protein
MTTYTITDAKNFTDLTLKTGNDTYNINGGTLLLDSDTRYGKNSLSTGGNTCPFGSITVSASLAGNFRVDTTQCRLIPFNGGSGTVPAYETTLSQAGADGQLLLVMSARTGGIIYTPGQPMPASGYLKVRKSSGNFAVGSISGIGCNATAADEQGWIFITGVEQKGHSHPRLGTCVFKGHPFEIGLTTGSRGQTHQLPYIVAESIIAYPGVEIEDSPGSDTYTFWPNAANSFTSANHSLDSRCNNVHISNTGVLTIGMGLDSQPCGHMPLSGCKIRIPTIITQTSNTTAFNVNKLPDTNMSQRYKSIFTSAGNLTAEWVTGDWFWTVAQAYTCYMRHIHCADQAVIQEIYSEPDIDDLHQGLSNYSGTYADGYGILFQQNYFGGKVGNISALRMKSNSLSGYPMVLVNLYGKWTFKQARAGNVGPATAISGAIQINTCPDLLIEHALTTTKRILVMSCKKLRILKHTYADVPIGTTGTTQATHAIEYTGMSEDCVSANICNWPDAPNTHPLNGLFFANSGKKLKFRNTGTAAAPFNAGTVNLMKYIFSDGGNNDTIKVKRNWVTALNNSISSGTNTTKGLEMVNNYTVDATKTIGPQQLESYYHGNRGNGGSVPMSYLSVYGTCMWDSFTSDTTTRAALVFVEKTNNTGSSYVATGTPEFTSQGAVVMNTVGDSIIWTWPWKILGWTGLTSSTPQGINVNNHSYEYDLDTGSGFTGVWKTCSPANLSSEIIDPVNGFKLSIKIAAVTSALTNRLDAFRIDGTTTLALQNAALYPLDEAELTLSGLVAGSTVAVFDENAAPGAQPLTIVENVATSAKLVYEYDEARLKCRLEIRKKGYDTLSLVFDNLVEISIPVAQQENKDGFGQPVFGRGPNTTKHLVTLSPTDLRIDIGNGKAIAEDVYDVIAEWQATPLGMRYPEVLRFDGTDLLLPTDWRFRRGSLSYTSAGIDALPVVDGQPNASPDDETNGSIDFKARSVRTYKLDNQPVYTLNDFAAAVWSFSQANGLTAENNLLGAKTSAETAVAIAASI